MSNPTPTPVQILLSALERAKAQTEYCRNIADYDPASMRETVIVVDRIIDQALEQYRQSRECPVCEIYKEGRPLVDCDRDWSDIGCPSHTCQKAPKITPEEIEAADKVICSCPACGEEWSGGTAIYAFKAGATFILEKLGLK